ARRATPNAAGIAFLVTPKSPAKRRNALTIAIVAGRSTRNRRAAIIKSCGTRAYTHNVSWVEDRRRTLRDYSFVALRVSAGPNDSICRNLPALTRRATATRSVGARRRGLLRQGIVAVEVTRPSGGECVRLKRSRDPDHHRTSAGAGKRRPYQGVRNAL